MLAVFLAPVAALAAARFAGALAADDVSFAGPVALAGAGDHTPLASFGAA